MITSFRMFMEPLIILWSLTILKKSSLDNQTPNMNFSIIFQIWFCLIFCTSATSDLITSTTFNDMIMDLQMAKDDSENTTKPWLVYIDAEMNYSILWIHSDIFPCFGNVC